MNYKTKQRAEILECLIDNRNRHMTADEIAQKLTEEGAAVGRATVYRTLYKLMEEGKVRRFIADEGRSSCYQLVDENGGCEEHFHLKCVKCGKLIHLKCDHLKDLEKHIFERHKFVVDNTRTVLYGICGECENEKNF